MTCFECGRELMSPREYRLHPELRGDRVPHGGRGLCDRCYTYARRHGQLPRYPRSKRWAAETADEVESLRLMGWPEKDIPAVLGIQSRSLRRTLRRHEQRCTSG